MRPRSRIRACSPYLEHRVRSASPPFFAMGPRTPTRLSTLLRRRSCSRRHRSSEMPTSSVVEAGGAQAGFMSLVSELALAGERKGYRFERLVQWYLRNEPMYVGQLRNVWLWDEWEGRTGRDIGVDLVAEGYDGGLWAIQA